MRRSLSPLHWSTPEPAPAQHCASPNTFDCLSAAGSFDSSSLSSCRIFSDAPSVRGYESQSGLQGSKDLSSVSCHSDQGAPLCVEALPPLRTSSHSAEFGVDVEGHPNLGWLVCSFIRSPQFPDYPPDTSRLDQRPTGSSLMRWHPGDVMTSSSASSTTQISEEEI